MKILIVDDNFQDIFLVKEMINDNVSVTIEECSDGDIALEKFNKNFYDIILLDIKMPKMSGIEFLEEIQNNTKKDNTTIIMLTTSEFEEEIQKCKELGSKGYIVKSTSPLEFETSIQSLINIFVKNNWAFINFDRIK